MFVSRIIPKNSANQLVIKMFYAVVVLLLVALVLWEFASSELLSYLSTVFST